MRNLLTGICCWMLTFSLGVGVHSLLPSTNDPPRSTIGLEKFQPEETPSISSSLPSADEWTSLADLLSDEESLQYNGYLIRRLYKTVLLEGSRPTDQGYVVISKDSKAIRSFDAFVHHPLGNMTEFGLFSFLGSRTKQLAISQTVPRGGTQWIVDLTNEARVVFDGVAWGVGREAYDCEVKDLDGDGVFEISFPITDFYALMDKMGMSGIPLPQITFQYDFVKKIYLPAKQTLQANPSTRVPDVDPEKKELFLSAVLSHTLDLIYAGKRVEAWQYFNATYNLDDKKEIERRVNDILRNQPVYKFIYKNR